MSRFAIIGFLGAAASLSFACGIFSPSVVQPVADLGACVAKEALEHKPVAQIAVECSSDVLSVIAALLASEQRVHGTLAYSEAVRTKMALSAPTDAGTP